MQGLTKKRKSSLIIRTKSDWSGSVVDGALVPDITLFLLKNGIMTKIAKNSLIINVKAGQPKPDIGGGKAEIYNK